MLSERCPVALCIASFLFLHVQAMPTVITAYPPSESGEVFQDDWDYKVEQSKTPLLQKLQQNHTLPPAANETVGPAFVGTRPRENDAFTTIC
jgi:hypothetical protein